MWDYTFIRSRRKTIGITIKPDGSIILRAPLWCSKREAERFLLAKSDWIERTQKKLREKKTTGQARSFSDVELREIRRMAAEIIPPLVEQTAREMGLCYERITLRMQRTRWGSCSAKGNLNFNCLLVLLPENVQKYVAVHELCHLREMNHSKSFWAEVAKFCPTYPADRRQLNKEGQPFMDRLSS